MMGFAEIKKLLYVENPDMTNLAEGELLLLIEYRNLVGLKWKKGNPLDKEIKRRLDEHCRK